MNRSNIPHLHVGMRTVKTVVVVFLSLCLAYVRQGFANPLYIAIAAILCIQPTMESSRIAGTNRLIGTFVGGFWGIAVFLINSYVFADLHIIAKYAFTSLALIPMIYTNIYIKRASMVATSAVVYLIITVSPVGNMTNLQFVFNRLLDTFMGFAIAMAVNRVRLPSEEELSAKKDAMKKRMEPENRNADLPPSDGKKQ
ncbi:MAG: FUSC family protein [Oscillospiraceae bacterium]|nr:FUSC family protein [Oscillospiraceae bacterium]